jgi:hypothetical protein
MLVMIGILSLMLLFIGFNFRTLYGLNGELKLTEQRQLRRLADAKPQAAAISSGTTNAQPNLGALPMPKPR